MDSIISFILGGILSILIGWIFYRKSIQRKSLVVNLDYFSKLFDTVEPEIKKELKILYKDNEIEHLYSVQFTFENNGNKPIRDIIEPLILEIPTDFEIMDAHIAEIKPEGRKVNIKQNLENNRVNIDFSLLNPKDTFVFRILFKGDVTSYLKNERMEELGYKNEEEMRYQMKIDDNEVVEHFKFTITVDELNPTLDISKESRNKDDDEESKIPLNVFHLFVGVAVGYILWYFTSENEFYLFNFSVFFKGFWSWFYTLNLFRISLLVTWMVPIFFTIKSSIVIIGYLIKRIGKHI